MGSGISNLVIGNQMKKLKADLEAEDNDLSKLIERAVQYLKRLKDATLVIAITGASGSGKSSLVNALRGIKDDEEGAAETGVTQTTMEAMKYSHPRFPKVTIWDLPGIGTPEFQAKNYLQMVNFEIYDFFIIAAERFTQHEVFLAREIHKMNKKFYHVRTKTDLAIADEGRKQNFNEEKTLEKIRKYCHDNLVAAGESDPRVFLISVRDLNAYDFPLLADTLGNDLDEFKRHALITMLSNSSKEMLKKKKNAMEALIWRVALVSSFTGAVPVPGLFFIYNIPFLEATLKDFSTALGLDEESLHRLANQVGKPVSELREAIRKTRVANQIDCEFVDYLLITKCADDEGIEEMIRALVNFIPLLGSLFGQGNCVARLFYMLHGFLNDALEDAERVWATAFEN